jgi:hypothetical protein
MAAWNNKVLAAWIAFESWASKFLGLDESKYEWAKYEQQLDLEEELENIATNNMLSERVNEAVILNRSCELHLISASHREYEYAGDCINGRRTREARSRIGTEPCSCTTRNLLL